VRRVLHVIGIMNLGGAETLIMNVYRKLDRSRIQFDFVTLNLNEGEYDPEIMRMEGRIFRIAPPSSAGLMKTSRDFRRILRQHGPFAAVHSHVHKFSGVFAFIAAREDVPVRVVHSHTTLDTRNDHGMRLGYSTAMRALIRRYGTSLVGCSQEACRTLFGPRYVNDDRVKVLHNGVDWTQFASEEAHRDRTRSRLGLDSDATVFCHVGNFCVPKNHGFLIAMFREIAMLLPKSHLLLVGDGPLRAGIISLISNSGLQQRVTVLGHRRDIPALLGASDMFLFPSLWEGVPTALIEAQMAGLACLASSRITTEADLGIGLIHFCNLETGPKHWANEALHVLETKRAVCLSARTLALEKTGYDISSVTKDLESIYYAVSLAR